MIYHVKAHTLSSAMPAFLLCLLACAPFAQQPASLIRNGSFEEGPAAPVFLNLPGKSTGLPGWVVTGEGIDLVGAGYWRASEGTHAIDLDGSARSRTTPPYVHGGIAQTFATQAGKRYRVTFDLAANTNHGPIKKPMRVRAAGDSADFIFDATGKNGRNMGWVSKEWVFTAKGDSSTLEFLSLTQSPETGYGAAIDRVAVVLLTDGLQVTESEKEIKASLGPDLPIKIDGHTDNVGTAADNERLSLNRAEAVKRWLVTSGSVPVSRITTRGFGSTRPVATNGTPEGRQKNRRVEVRLRK